MTQIATPAPVRTSAVADAPDVFSVLRRYIWLIIIGTMLGSAIGAGLFFYLRRYHPQYTAHVTFQVLPPSPPPGQTRMVEMTSTQEEITRFIRRQMSIIRSERIMEDALSKDEFQRDVHDPQSDRKSRWLREHSSDTKDAFTKDLEVTPIASSELFVINFTASDAEEAKRLVNCIARVYVENLKEDNRVNTAAHLADLRKILDDQQADVNLTAGKLKDYRDSRNVDAIAPRHEIELKTLAEYNAKLVEAEAKLATAEMGLKSVQAQKQSGTLALSPEYSYAVENDPQVRQLDASRIALEQEMAVGRSKGQLTEQVRALQVRMDVVLKQMEDRRAELTNTFRARMETDAVGMASSLKSFRDYLADARTRKDKEVKDIDEALVGARKLEEELKAKQAILNDLTSQYTIERLKSATDDSRIRKLGGDAVTPDKISWPIWWRWWIPLGFFGGLFFSFGAAYLFELTNTRVRTPSDVTRTLQLPLLGFVPDREDDAAATGELSTTIRTSPNSMIAESFRQIRGRLIAQADGTPVKTLLVASIAPEGGATTVASNIANGMALNEMRVLLVDANFYRPGLPHSYKNLPALGLADVVANPSELDAAIVASEQMPNLHLMGTGKIPVGTPAEMLEGRSFRDLLDQLKSRYDIVIFDGSPLSLVSDSIALGGRVDGVVAVVRAGEVSRGTVSRVREQLRHVRARLLGIVLNAAQTHGAGYFKENYRTFYEYAGQGNRGANN